MFDRKLWLCDKKMMSLILSGTLIMAGETVVILANTIIAGNMIGETAIAAVNLVMPIYSFIAFVAVAVSMGTAVIFSQEMGKSNLEEARKVFSQGMIASLAMGILTFLLVMGLKGLILKSAEGTGELYSLASQYYTVLAFMAIIYPPLVVLLDTVYSDGGEKFASLAYVPMVGMSIVFSIILCPRMGIGGIALGTIVGQVIAVAVVCIHFFTKKCTLRFRRYFNLKRLIISMKYSITGSGTYLCWAILLVIINSFFLTRFGGEKLPVLTAVSSLMEITIIFDGVGAAIQPMMGLYRGEHNTKVIEHLMKTAAVVAFAEGIILSMIVMLFPKLLVFILGIDDPMLVTEAIRAIRIYGTSLLAPSLLLLLSSYYLYSDRIGLVLINMALQDFVMPLACVLIYGMIGGITGVWVGFAQGNFMALMAMVLITMLIHGKDDFPLYLDRSREKNQCVVNLTVDKDKPVAIPERIREFLNSRETDKNKVRDILERMEQTLSSTSCKGKGHLYVEFMIDSSKEETSIIMRDNGKLREQEESVVPVQSALHETTEDKDTGYASTEDSSEDIISDNVAMGMNRMSMIIKKSRKR